MQRRNFLLGLSAAALGPRPAEAAASVPERLVSLDYALTETMLSFGAVPFAQSSASDWATWVDIPALPASVIDIGLDREPNLELLAALKPDRFLATPYLDRLIPTLERLAPVTRLGIYDEAPGRPLEKAMAAARSLGALLGREPDADAFVAETEDRFAACARRIAALPTRPLPLHLVSFVDPRHVWIYGHTSLFQGVLDRLGLENAWEDETNLWGFSAIGIEGLASATPSRLVAFAPIPDDVLPTLEKSPLWRDLPFVRAGTVSTLPTILRFGGLRSALRFAEILTTELERAAA